MEIKIKDEYIELNKLLKLSGIAESGGLAKTMIEAGEVKVDNEVELRKRCKLRPGQKVEAAGQTVTIA